MKIDNDLNTLYENSIDDEALPEGVFHESSARISDQSLRIRVLSRLYMPSIKELLPAHNKKMGDHFNTIGEYNHNNARKKPLDKIKKEAEEAKETYKNSLDEILNKLEKMVS